MMPLTYVALTTLLWLTTTTMTEAYSEGAPVNKYPEICENMSPIIGHHTEPQSSLPPFEIRLLTTDSCYKAGQPMTVQVASIDEAMHFEGFFVQARTVQSGSYDTGTFDVLDDTQLLVLTCGNATIDNSVGQGEAHHYFEKKFNWTASADHGDIHFVGTIVKGTRVYWMDVTSQRLRYDVNCVVTESAAATSTSLISFSKSFVLVLVVLALIRK